MTPLFPGESANVESVKTIISDYVVSNVILSTLTTSFKFQSGYINLLW